MRPVTAFALALCTAWQAVICVLGLMGIFVDLYDLIGIPWSATGLRKLVGTATSLLILESPVISYILWLAWRHSRSHKRTQVFGTVPVLDSARASNLPRFGVSDMMVTVVACALSIWMFSLSGFFKFEIAESTRDLCFIIIVFLSGPTWISPLWISLQFLQGRKGLLLSGELVWLFLAVWRLQETIIVVLLLKAAGREGGMPLDMVVCWLMWGSPLVIMGCTLPGVFWHFRSGKPQHWSHRAGLGIGLLQSIASVALAVGLAAL